MGGTRDTSLFVLLIAISLVVPATILMISRGSAAANAGSPDSYTAPWSRPERCGWPTRSFGSVGSTASIGSVGSLWSIGSVGSILSIGSVGSVLSIGSFGCAGSMLALLAVLSFGGCLGVGQRAGPWGLRRLRRALHGRRPERAHAHAG